MIKYLFTIAAIGLLCFGCAVPQPPTGGPRDQVAPAIVHSDPQEGSTNVTPEAVTLTFSEYVNQASLQRALSIIPPFEAPLEFDWDGRSVTIYFPSALRPNTTYVLTIRTDFQDLHGIQLQAPITLAFSTGPTINKHILKGRVVHALEGKAAAEYSIFAYPAPPDTSINPLTTAPAYRTQTDMDGYFTLNYLPDTTFFVAAVRDLNRNYRPDADEQFAVPADPRLPTHLPDTIDTAVTLVTTRLDTIPPKLQRIESASATRTNLSFSEPVRLDTLHPEWIFAASGSSEDVPVSTAYRSATDPYQVTVITEPLQPITYRFMLTDGVTDTTGNAVYDTTLSFTPVARPDTLALRLEEWLPPASDTPYPATVYPGIRLNRFVPAEQLARYASVQDSAGRPIPGQWQTNTGTEYRFVFEDPFPSKAAVTVELNGTLFDKDTVYTHRISYIPKSQYGSVSGMIFPADSSRATVELYALDTAGNPTYSTTADSTGSFLFPHTPAGSYRLRTYRDPNRNNAWDGGRLYPYHRPEPVTWIDSLTVRARWETDLDTVRLEHFSSN